MLTLSDPSVFRSRKARWSLVLLVLVGWLAMPLPLNAIKFKRLYLLQFVQLVLSTRVTKDSWTTGMFTHMEPCTDGCWSIPAKVASFFSGFRSNFKDVLCYYGRREAVERCNRLENCWYRYRLWGDGTVWKWTRHFGESCCAHLHIDVTTPCSFVLKLETGRFQKYRVDYSGESLLQNGCIVFISSCNPEITWYLVYICRLFIFGRVLNLKV
jgi:hypothetical protein